MSSCFSQAKTSGKFSDEELDKLWREFKHHREKIHEYNILLETVSRTEGAWTFLWCFEISTTLFSAHCFQVWNSWSLTFLSELLADAGISRYLQGLVLHRLPKILPAIENVAILVFWFCLHFKQGRYHQVSNDGHSNLLEIMQQASIHCCKMWS